MQIFEKLKCSNPTSLVFGRESESYYTLWCLETGMMQQHLSGCSELVWKRGFCLGAFWPNIIFLKKESIPVGHQMSACQPWRDRHDWKHYLPATSLMGGRNNRKFAGNPGEFLEYCNFGKVWTLLQSLNLILLIFITSSLYFNHFGHALLRFLLFCNNWTLLSMILIQRNLLVTAQFSL